MTISFTNVGLGAAPGDGTGDPARTGGGTINTNFSTAKTAIEALQSGKFEVVNVTQSVGYGEKIICNSHAGITLTLPAAEALRTDDYNGLVIWNCDSADAVTISGGTDLIYRNGSSLGTSTTIDSGYMGFLSQRSGTAWDLFLIDGNDPATPALNDNSDVTLTGLTDDEILQSSGGTFINQTLEEAGIVETAAPVFGANPVVLLTDHGSVTGTEDIVCADEPFSILTVAADNVTINLDVPALSLPYKGLSNVKIGGLVKVLIDGTSRSGLTVTTDSTSSITSLPKGTAPSSANDEATLAWYWYKTGSDDYLWAEWIDNT